MFYYKLTIEVSDALSDVVSEILGVKSTFKNGCGYGWGYEISESEEDRHYDFINEFIGVLEGKERMLEEIGVTKKDVTFWMIYEYDDQCNLEFRSEQMRRLGKNGYDLCISCYQSSSEYKM